MNIKKIIFTLGFSAIAFLSSAQVSNEVYFAPQETYNSLNFSQTNPVLGTARYSGMGGAMGALGGDATTAKDNPAGLGVYRSSDITLTPNVYIANDNSVGFNINNFGVILNFRNSGKRSGYITSSLGVSYNRLKNFKRNTDLMSTLGYSMTDYMSYAPGYFQMAASDVELIDEDGNSLFPGNTVNNEIRYNESGSIGEWDFSYGVNISNRFYFGATVGFVNLDYTLDAMYDEQTFDNNLEYAWYLDNYYEATGAGFNLKLGAIASITDFMRVGLAFHTPTFYDVEEHIYEEIGYSVFENEFYDDYFYGIETNTSGIALQTPLKLQGSLGFIIGKTAIIGLEYQYEDFSTMRYSTQGRLHQQTKELINAEMKTSHTAKAGAEVRVVDGFSLRAGFAFVSAPSVELSKDIYSEPEFFQAYPLAQPQNTFYYTGGIGYKGKYFYADLAYVHQVKKEVLFEYLPQHEAVDPYTLSLHNSSISATFGVRF